MNNNLVEAIRIIAHNLSNLSELIQSDGRLEKAFSVAVSDTLALPMSLDEFAVEWASVADNVAVDSELCKLSWKASAKFYREATIKDQHWLDMELDDNDIVFEDKSFIQTVPKLNDAGTYFEYVVTIGRDALSTIDYQEACDYLWENHVKTGYGVE